MKKVSLQFKDVLQLLEFMELTKNHDGTVDLERLILRCEIPEAEIELAVNGYMAMVIDSTESASNEN